MEKTVYIYLKGVTPCFFRQRSLISELSYVITQKKGEWDEKESVGILPLGGLSLPRLGLHDPAVHEHLSQLRLRNLERKGQRHNGQKHQRSAQTISGKNIRIVEASRERIQIDKRHEIQDLLSNYWGQASDQWIKYERLMDQISNERF